MKLRNKIILYNNGNPRRLMEISENSDGTLIIKNNPGLQIGYPPDNKVIKENRYSIHPSSENEKYSTIKNHFYFVDDTQSPPTYLYTSAIKSKNGFTPIVNIRYSDLQTPSNELGRTRNGTKIINLGHIDFSKNTLILSIFVGHCDCEFNIPENYSAGKFEMVINSFKLVILTSIMDIPASPLAFFINIATHGDGIAHQEELEPFDNIWEGMDVPSCLDFRDNFIQLALVELEEAALRHLEYIEKQLAKEYRFNFYKSKYTYYLHKP